MHIEQPLAFPATYVSLKEIVMDLLLSHCLFAIHRASKHLVMALFFTIACQTVHAQAKWHITGGTVKIIGETSLVLQDADLINDGQLTASGGIVSFSGTAQNTLGGTGVTQLFDLHIDKSEAALLQLGNDLFGSRQVLFVQGHLDLNGHNLLLGQEGILVNEAEQHRILGPAGGEIIKTVNLNAPAGVNPGNLGLTISSPSNLGPTTIHRGHQAQVLGNDAGIERYFTVTPTNNAALDATILFSYFDAERNGLPEATLSLWEENNGMWEPRGSESHDTTSNLLEINNLEQLQKWTAGVLQTGPDSDGDQIPDNSDNCPDVANPDQEDTNNNGVGDVCECQGTDIVLSPQTITQDTQHRAEETIVSSETLTNGATVIYQAGTSITLQPGFHAGPGTTFSAVIEDCAIPPAANLLSHAGASAPEVLPEPFTPDGEPQLRVAPNPFVSETQFAFSLPEKGWVDLTMVDVSGKQVGQLSGGTFAAGVHRQTWAPRSLPGGIYFARLVFEGRVFTQKVVLIGR
jgi:hypothetical protein